MTTPIERTNNDQWELLAFNYIDTTRRAIFLIVADPIDRFIYLFFFFRFLSSLFSFHLCYFKEKTYWFSVFVEIILEMGFSSRILIRFRGL